MIFGTHIGWVGAPEHQKHFRPRITPKAYPPTNVKFGRISGFGTRNWGSPVCLLDAHTVGPFWWPNWPYQKHIIFQFQLLTPKIRFCSSIPTHVAGYATTFSQSIHMVLNPEREIGNAKFNPQMKTECNLMCRVGIRLALLALKMLRQ